MRISPTHQVCGRPDRKKDNWFTEQKDYSINKDDNLTCREGLA